MVADDLATPEDKASSVTMPQRKTIVSHDQNWWLSTPDFTVLHYSNETIEPSHKSHNAPVPNPTMHHFVTEMCTPVHISVTKWYIVGYLSDAFQDLWDGSIINNGIPSWSPVISHLIFHSIRLLFQHIHMLTGCACLGDHHSKQLRCVLSHFLTTAVHEGLQTREQFHKWFMRLPLKSYAL